jgi:hypothetical protein
MSPHDLHATMLHLLGLDVDRKQRKQYRPHAPELPAQAAPRKNLAQFLLESPFAGSDLDLDQRQDYGRAVDL